MALLVALLLVLTVTPAAADEAAEEFRQDIRELEQQQSRVRREAARLEDEQRRVRTEQQRIAADLQAATDRLAELEAELAEILDEAHETARDVTALEDRHAEQRRMLGQRVRALYRLGGIDPLLMVLSGRSAGEALERTHYVSALTNKDQTAIEAYAATTTRLERRQRDLEDARREATRLQAEVEQAREDLAARMEEAAAAEDRLIALSDQARANLAELEQREQTRRAEEQARLNEIERQRREQEERRTAEAARKAEEQKQAAAAAAPRRASRSSSGSGGGGSGGGGRGGGGGGKACPQGQPRSFTNDWGAARSGGRSHQGTDIFGRMGGPVYAITGGTIQFTKTGASAGLFLSLRGNDGHTYWYMHLSGFAASAGQRVSAGQLIGYNGNTGNARGATPHIHFEYHPGGGGPSNPYPLLRSIC